MLNIRLNKKNTLIIFNIIMLGLCYGIPTPLCALHVSCYLLLTVIGSQLDANI